MQIKPIFSFQPSILTSLTVLFLTATSAFGATTEVKRPQNVLFIVADDMRPWLGCYGHPQAKTPNLDALAASGVRFDSAHVQYSLCMPSRTSLLSGCRPDEAGRAFWIGRKADRSSPYLLSIRAMRPGIVSLPEHFRKHGWHSD